MDVIERNAGQGELFSVSVEAREAPARKGHVRSIRIFRSTVDPELYPTRASELVPKDSSAHLVLRIVSRLDLKLLRMSYEDHGGVPYAPEALLGVMLLAYSLGVSSSRQMEDRCRYDLRFMVVAGGAQPDYRTLARFRRRLESVMDEFFKQVLAICKQEKILRLERVALDGTKVRSAASQLQHWLTGKDAEEIAEMGLEAPETSDPQARVVRSAKGFVLGYNVQAAVDMDSGIVTAYDVFTASPDRELLPPMLERVKELAGASPGQIVADAGYDSGASYQAAEDASCQAIIASQDDTALFWTPVSETEIVCPMGKSPTRKRRSLSHGEPTVVYSVAGCSKCQFFKSCCSSRFGRSLSVQADANPVLRVIGAHLARSPEGRQAMVERFASIEPVFGRLKANKGMNRFRLRGLAGARLEVALMCLAENITILGRQAASLIGLFLALRLRQVRFCSSNA